MNETLVELVWQRARERCEYCQRPQVFSWLPFEIDHIIACKHDGKSRANNLALSCAYDNAFQGSNIAGIDPKTRRLTRLFHPRRHKWHFHFRWEGPNLTGRTAIGRTTVAVLAINQPLRVDQRQELMNAGLFPPP